MQYAEMICISSRSTTRGQSEALSDGVRCGLSLVAFKLALCVVELAIVYSSCELCVCLGDQAFWCHWCALGADVLGEPSCIARVSFVCAWVIKRFGVIGVRWVLTYLVKYFRGGGRLKFSLRGSLVEAVLLKRSVKIAAVEDSVLR
ncbi:hypothetical protein IGI04_006880 [Brassica rapa subsp. trilocularis]|uniref:Uncharacterized protein n=1 Tax=Brassica rapa subsp. trilocularis TaxID=1813537 RepID=A0ABQ7NJF8_BRACM|nr:hypothetical protein IGI04_006880 [Brassica rapa subsp. trilocularis]